MLLNEAVSIRQLGIILETLADYAGKTKDPIWLVEYVRHRLARTICTQYRDEQDRVYVVTLDPALEDRISAGIEHTERGLFIRMSPQAIDVTCDQVFAELENLVQAGHRPVVLVSPQIRPGFRQLISAKLPKVVVLSYNEMTRDTQIESVGMVSDVMPEMVGS